jgi:hypothetical protein
MSIKLTDEHSYEMYLKRVSPAQSGADDYTPIELIKPIINAQLIDWSDSNLKILDPCFGFGGFLFYIYSKLKNYHSDEHIFNNMIYGIEIDAFRHTLVQSTKLPIKNLYRDDFLNPSPNLKNILNMKFDVIIGNPPYQLKVGPGKTEPIWNKFVENSFKYLKDDGYLSFIHPTGWRSPAGKFKNIQTLLKSKKIIHLSVNDFDEGNRIFGVGTAFDWYIIKNESGDCVTKLIDSNKISHNIDLSTWEFIPNAQFDKFQKLVAKEGEERIKVLYSRSAYGTDKPNISFEKTNSFVYPCVYTITKKDGINLVYSNLNSDEHFGVPKVIWTNGLGTYPIVDILGEYGLTQFAYAIEDTPNNLQNIKTALNSEEFLNLMKYIKFTNNKYDYKVISTFRKDFWKEFVQC